MQTGLSLSGHCHFYLSGFCILWNRILKGLMSGKFRLTSHWIMTFACIDFADNLLQTDYKEFIELVGLNVLSDGVQPGWAIRTTNDHPCNRIPNVVNRISKAGYEFLIWLRNKLRRLKTLVCRPEIDRVVFYCQLYGQTFAGNIIEMI